MALHYETKVKDIEELKKEEIVKAFTTSETDQERDPLYFPSLHKADNPYKSPIPLKCRPKEVGNDKKLLKLKGP